MRHRKSIDLIGRSAASVPKAPPPAKGRGAQTNAAARYERYAREAVDDGWAETDPEPPKRRTDIAIETPRTIISRNDSPDISFDRTINPYRGCEHGCIYCYARPNHAYVDLSPGLDFESKLFVKANAADLLERELADARYAPNTIVLSGVTDAYQPIEREHRATRAVLEVLARTNHPVAIVTKSQLVLRDLDLLAPMAAKGLVRVAVSLTTLDKTLARRMEPRAAAPHRRLETMRALAESGIPVTVMTAPIIPALNDPELETLLEAAAGAGATSAGYVMLRLPLEIADLFQEWLAAHYPDRAARIMSHVRAMRGGKNYDATFGKRGRGEGPYAALIAARFAKATKRLGLNAQPSLALDVSLFKRPVPPGGQFDLF